jgi:hypothetical protein
MRMKFLGNLGGLVRWGYYTPTATSVANCDGVSTTTDGGMYLKIGWIVFVIAKFTCDPTVAGNNTQVGIALPIASDLTSAVELLGLGTNVGDSTRFYIEADSTNNRADCNFRPAGGGAELAHIVFAYRIK